VVHPPVCGAGLEDPSSCRVGGQLAPLVSLMTGVDGVPVQSRPVIVDGQVGAMGVQCRRQPTAFATATGSTNGAQRGAMLLRVLQESTQRRHRTVLNDEVDVLTAYRNGDPRQNGTGAEFPQWASSNERSLAVHRDSPGHRSPGAASSPGVSEIASLLDYTDEESVDALLGDAPYLVPFLSPSVAGIDDRAVSAKQGRTLDVRHRHLAAGRGSTTCHSGSGRDTANKLESSSTT